MFSTQSSMTHLTPKVILRCVQESEMHCWQVGDLFGFSLSSSDAPRNEEQDLGSILLNHGAVTKQIHAHFSKLEEKKCCLHLACQRSALNTMRPVPTSKSDDDGSAKSSRPTRVVDYLENKDLRTFKHAFLCAVYPVLSAPEPPPPLSPSPVYLMPGTPVPTGHIRSNYSEASAMYAAGVIPSRPSTPYSLHDSGVEESEDTGQIPMESICEQLRRAFRLTHNVFHQYEVMIVKTYVKKSSERLLAEELSCQLTVLETNTHPFYSPRNFITQNGYDLWQQHERNHISGLLSKFWHTSLPFPQDSQDLIAELHSVHDDYHILLKKLLQYERNFRSDSGVISGTAAYTPLSSASWRLLLEFALRYGVGEMYRKVMYLECLTTDFSPTVGYLSHVHHMLNSIQQMLPANRSSIVMVKQELNILYSSLKSLKIQSCKSLSQMKFLFGDNRSTEGIDILLLLLQSVMDMMSYLRPGLYEDFGTCIKKTVRSMFRPAYELFKSVAKEDLGHGREIDIDPRMLNTLIQDIREDVSNYKNKFEVTFQTYFSISKMAASAFYNMLMDDVKALSEAGPKRVHEIDLRMLGLAYRLKTLDNDWNMYIPTHLRSWRVSFLSCLNQWTSSLRSHIQKLMLDAVAADVYSSRQLTLSPSVLTSMSKPASITSSERCSCSLFSASFTPSANSAFNSVVSSLRPSPKLEISNDNIQEQEEQEERNDHKDYPTPPPGDCHLSASVNGERIKPSRPLKDSFLSTSLNLSDNQSNVVRFSAFRPVSLPERVNQLDVECNFLRIQQGSCSPQPEDPKVYTISNIFDINSTSADSKPYGASFSNGGQDSLSEHDSSDEDFRFPPLKIASPNPDMSISLPDFTDPVFTKIKSSEFSRTSSPHVFHNAHEHQADASSSRACSATPSKFSGVSEHMDEHANPQQLDYLDSFESNISSSLPPNCKPAMLPISGSAVDVIVILQRLCCFSQTLATMLIDEKDSAAPDSPSAPSHQSTSHHSAHDPIVREKPLQAKTRTTAESFDSEKPSGSLYNHRHSHFEVVGDSGSPCGSQSDDIDLVYADAESHSFIGASELSGLIGPRVKCSLHLKILKAMCNMIVVYSGNMLCMDLCGTPRPDAKRLVGTKLLGLIENQQMSGLVWGCRHQKDVPYDCLYYLNRKAKLLADRHEPVIQQMCTRINNVTACRQYVRTYHEQLLQAFNFSKEKLATSDIYSDGDRDSAIDATDFSSTLSADFIQVHHPAEDKSNDGEGFSTSLTSDGGNIQCNWSCEAEQTVDATKQHIKSVVSAMCRLLAYKLNLFVRDGLPLLLHLKNPRESIAQCLAPITSFLQKYLDSLSTWLYRTNFLRVLGNLWVFIVQDIEIQAHKLKTSGSTANSWGHKWMLAISHLIKFINNNGTGIRKDLLLAQADAVIFQMQLYTLSTWHLITLFHSLRDYYTEGDHLTLEENQMRTPPTIIHRIHRELQSLRKCFSGAELVHWIIKHEDALPVDLALPPGPITREKAIAISQTLLDQSFIEDVESEGWTRSPSPVSDMSAHYPPISESNRKFSDQEHDWNGDSRPVNGEVHSVMVHLPNGRDSNEDVTPTPQDNDSTSPTSPNITLSPQDKAQSPSPDCIRSMDRLPIRESNTRFSDQEAGSSGSSTPENREVLPPGGMDSCETVSATSQGKDSTSEDRRFPTSQKKPLSQQDKGNTIESSNKREDKEQSSNALSDCDQPRGNSTEIPSLNRMLSLSQKLQTSNTGMSQSATHSDFRSGTQPGHFKEFHRRCHSETFSASSLFSNISERHTPFFNLAESVFNNNKPFVNSSEKFYVIHQKILHPGLINHSQGPPSSSKEMSLTPMMEQEFLRLKGSRESRALMEQCFIHKITPMTILSIISGRKKADIIAKEYMKQLPRSLQDKVKNLLDEPSMDCTSS